MPRKEMESVRKKPKFFISGLVGVGKLLTASGYSEHDKNSICCKGKKGSRSKKVLRKSSVTFCYYLKSYQFDPNLIFTDELCPKEKFLEKRSVFYLDLLLSCLNLIYGSSRACLKEFIFFLLDLFGMHFPAINFNLKLINTKKIFHFLQIGKNRKLS